MTRTVVRRSTAAITLATLFGAAFVVAGGSASADTPITTHGGGWEPKPQVNDLHALGLFVGVPILVLLVIAALVLAPALARGEKLFSYDGAGDGQWLGGPRKSAGELAEPDSEGSAAGGAGGTW